jgi:hypothetical protein
VPISPIRPVTPGMSMAHLESIVEQKRTTDEQREITE